MYNENSFEKIKFYFAEFYHYKLSLHLFGLQERILVCIWLVQVYLYLLYLLCYRIRLGLYYSFYEREKKWEEPFKSLFQSKKVKNNFLGEFSDITQDSKEFCYYNYLMCSCWLSEAYEAIVSQNCDICHIEKWMHENLGTVVAAKTILPNFPHCDAILLVTAWMHLVKKSEYNGKGNTSSCGNW